MAVLSAKLSLQRPELKDQQLFEQAYGLARRLLTKQIPKQKIRKVMTFLRYYLRFDNPEISAKFVKALKVLTEKSNTMGIEELLLDQAKKEGKLEDAKEIASAMKNEGFPVDQIAKFTKLSIDEIEKL